MTVGIYLMDPKCRQAFANEAIAKVVMQIVDSKYSVSCNHRLHLLVR